MIQVSLRRPNASPACHEKCGGFSKSSLLPIKTPNDIVDANWTTPNERRIVRPEETISIQLHRFVVAALTPLLVDIILFPVAEVAQTLGKPIGRSIRHVVGEEAEGILVDDFDVTG